MTIARHKKLDANHILKYKTLFLTINVLGGILVLGGYAIGLTRALENPSLLWGNVPETWRGAYGISMIIAAIGYLGFFFHIMMDNKVNQPLTKNHIALNTVVTLCALFLISASMWMPAALQFIKTGADFWWMITVGSLWITSLAVIGIFITLIVQSNCKQLKMRLFAILGGGYLGFHCLVLDAIIWVIKFPTGLYT